MLNTGGSGAQIHCDRAHAIMRADRELRDIFACGGCAFTIEDCAVASRICECCSVNTNPKFEPYANNYGTWCKAVCWGPV